MITTTGLMVGLYAGTESVVAVVGGVMVIAVADAMSDALGIHVAQEADPSSTVTHIWAATFATLITKFLVAASFILPLVWLPLRAGVLVALLWGLVVMTVLSILLARSRGVRALPIVAEHLVVGLLVVVLAHVTGRWINGLFS